MRMPYREKNFRLSGLCTIQSGFTARGKLDRLSDGGILAIQLRDMDGVGPLDSGTLGRYSLDEPFERYLVGTGDVLFRSRGERNTATALDDTFAGHAVALLPIVILRPRRDLIDPAFLAWSINQAPAQRHFDLTAQGQVLRMVPKSSLDTLAIDVPDIATQRLIVTINKLAKDERRLAQDLAELHAKLTSRLLIEASARTSRGNIR